MRNIILAVFIAVGVAGCARGGLPMSEVMGSCDNGQPFSQYAVCIKTTYDAKGNRPKSGSTLAFYAIMADIREQVANGKSTEVQAKAALYRAWLETIDADNKANAGRSVPYPFPQAPAARPPGHCTGVGNMMFC